MFSNLFRWSLMTSSAYLDNAWFLHRHNNDWNQLGYDSDIHAHANMTYFLYRISRPIIQKTYFAFLPYKFRCMDTRTCFSQSYKEDQCLRLSVYLHGQRILSDVGDQHLKTWICTDGSKFFSLGVYPHLK